MPDLLDVETAAALIDRITADRFELTLPLLRAYQGSATQLIADGDVWQRQATGTANGTAAIWGTVQPAQGGGFWVRQYAGPILPEWFGVPTDGVTDAQPGIRRLVNALREGDSVNWLRRTYQIKTADLFVIDKARVTFLADGATFAVAPTLRRDYWVGLFQIIRPRFRAIGELTVDCGVPASLDERTADGARAVQRGFLVNDQATDAEFHRVHVLNPANEGFSGRDGSGGVMRECTVTHRTGYLDAERTQIWPEGRTCFSVVSALFNDATTLDGTNGFSPSLTRAKSLPATNNRWVYERCTATNGTHGFAVINGQNVDIDGCHATNQSHRNIGVGPTAEHIHVKGGRYTEAGSTNIHFANGCRYFSVRGTTVDAQRLTGLDGDGIKAYVGCTDFIIEGNIVLNALWNGIKVAWAAARWTIANNQITLAAGRQVQGTHGILVVSRLFDQAQGFSDLGVVAPDAGIWDGTVTGNTVTGAYAALGLMYQKNATKNAGIPGAADPAPDSEAMLAVQGVSITGNTAVQCQFGFSAHDFRHGGGASSANYVRGNSWTDQTTRNVFNTTVTAGAVGGVTYGYFDNIRGIPHAGAGFGGPAGVQLLSLDGTSLRINWAGAGAPTASGVYANGHSYLNTTTGERHTYQNGAWAKVAAA